ncbi:MAG TPA: ferrous iron transport protein A [Desulfobacteraceae bacterium]|nr:ferrous iron transport protein A [Desulfobacteraceae bacterium]
MKKMFQEIFCSCTKKHNEQCAGRLENCPDNARPLSKACGCERLKVCKIRGDRQLCARMAQLGVLPGSEIELICPLQSQNCMVRIMGSTVSLDQLSADNIFVTPA